MLLCSFRNIGHLNFWVDFCIWCKAEGGGGVQCSQHHLLKRLSFPHCASLAPVSYVTDHTCTGVFLDSILFHCYCFTSLNLFKDNKKIYKSKQRQEMEFRSSEPKVCPIAGCLWDLGCSLNPMAWNLGWMASESSSKWTGPVSYGECWGTRQVHLSCPSTAPCRRATRFQFSTLALSANCGPGPELGSMN